MTTPNQGRPLFESTHYSVRDHHGGLLMTRHDGRSILLQAGDDSQSLRELLERGTVRGEFADHVLEEYFACLSPEADNTPAVPCRPGP